MYRFIAVGRTCSIPCTTEYARLFIVFAEFPDVYKDGRTMILMEEEDVLPTKSSIFSS
jgi:hypothetical protein